MLGLHGARCVIRIQVRVFVVKALGFGTRSGMLISAFFMGAGTSKVYDT